MACDDPGESSEQVFATREAKVAGVQGKTKQEVFDAVRQWWKKNDFHDAGSESDILYAESNSDGFRMKIEQTPRGDFYLGFSSPCVPPNGPE